MKKGIIVCTCINIILLIIFFIPTAMKNINAPWYGYIYLFQTLLLTTTLLVLFNNSLLIIKSVRGAIYAFVLIAGLDIFLSFSQFLNHAKNTKSLLVLFIYIIICIYLIGYRGYLKTVLNEQI